MAMLHCIAIACIARVSSIHLNGCKSDTGTTLMTSLQTTARIVRGFVVQRAQLGPLSLFCRRTYNMLYYKQVSKKKQTSLDDTMTGLVKQFSTERPAYGTRRLAAMVSRNLQMPVNRKHKEYAVKWA